MRKVESLNIVPTKSRDWAEVREEFVSAQSGTCAICRTPLRSPVLDHCHVTGFIRGALCKSCNVKLGWYEKRRAHIEAYLSRAAEFAAYVSPVRLSRAERWRRYWQTKRKIHRRTDDTHRTDRLRAYWQAKRFD